MKRLILLVAIACSLTVTAVAQVGNNGDREGFGSMTYRQVDEVRNELGLDHKQFDKVYNAYNKYNEAVFATMAPSPMGGPHEGGGVRPKGGPGSGPGAPGMGGGRPPMGNPDMIGMHPRGQSPKKIDSEKMEKIKVTQEEKLRKSMKKILRTETLYKKWLSIREAQLTRNIPKGPHNPKDRPAK